LRVSVVQLTSYNSKPHLVVATISHGETDQTLACGTATSIGNSWLLFGHTCRGWWRGILDRCAWNLVEVQAPDASNCSPVAATGCAPCRLQSRTSDTDETGFFPYDIHALLFLHNVCIYCIYWVLTILEITKLIGFHYS